MSLLLDVTCLRSRDRSGVGINDADVLFSLIFTCAIADAEVPSSASQLLIKDLKASRFHSNAQKPWFADRWFRSGL